MKIYNLKYYSSLLLFCVAVVLLLGGCEEFDIREGIREVDFKVTANTSLITEGESITYKDSSINVSSRVWTFEGGSVATSDKVEQEVNYPTAGRYGTTLEVTFADGGTKDRLFYVDVEPQVAANFDADLRTVVIGGSVQYTNLTTGLDNPANVFAINDDTKEKTAPVYQWEFEGGVPATSTSDNPVVNYPTTGTFRVKLVATRYAPENVGTVEKVGFINVVDVNVISPATVTLTKFGSQLNLAYPEGFSAIPAEELDNFSLSVDGNDSPIASISIDPTDDKILVLSLTNPVEEGNSAIVLNYGGGSLFATSGSLAAPIIDFNVANSVVNLWTGNVGFEEGAAGAFPPSWGTWNPTQGVNNNEFYQTTETEVKAGARALEISYDGSGDQWILDNKVPADVIPDGNYRVSFWAKSTLDGAIFDIRVIENGWAAANDPQDVALTTEWQQYTFDFVANDAGAVNRKVWWQLPGSAETFKVYVDDLKLYYLD